jgi:hypothetical protein
VSKVSDEFFDALARHGTICGVCHCGRVHFASWDTGFYEGELEDLLAKAGNDPKKYIEHCDTSVDIARIDGKDFVYDCPCEELVRYEQFVWTYREEILKYLIARHENQVEDLKLFTSKLNKHRGAWAALDAIHVPEPK